MKKQFLAAGFLCLTTLISAQVGKYEKVGEEQTETIELFDNKAYEYTFKNQWAKSTSIGQWEMNNVGFIVLSSRIQLSHFSVKEQFVPSQNKEVKIVVGGESKGKAPKSIRSVRIVSGDTLFCPANNDDIIAEMDIRNQLQTKGSAQQQDSLRQTETRRHYKCSYKDAVQWVEIKTDKYCIQFKPTQPNANYFEITTKWSDDTLYAYFDKEPFVIEKKQLKVVKTGEYYKPAKK